MLSESHCTSFDLFLAITMHINTAHEKAHLWEKKKKAILLDISKNKLPWNCSSKVCSLILVNCEKTVLPKATGPPKQINSHTLHKYSQLEIPSVLVKSSAAPLYKCSKSFEQSVRNCSYTQDIPPGYEIALKRNSIYRKITPVLTGFHCRSVTPRVTESWFNPKPLSKCVLYPHTALS